MWLKISHVITLNLIEFQTVNAVESDRRFEGEQKTRLMCKELMKLVGSLENHPSKKISPRKEKFSQLL